MPNSLTGLLDSTRLLFDLQQGNEIVQGISGCLEPEEIAHQITEGLVKKFDCAFARIWLLEPDKTTLKLVASSGMYTRLNGFFARVPMGAYKVGKIAQNRVSFLSNNLPDESWVGNREWALENNIRGFAGYPLAVKDRVVGVLATFSHQGMEPEFLEVLQTLCTMVTIALDAALQYQQEKQTWQFIGNSSTFSHSLSDQVANILNSRLTLVGTEQSLTLPVVYVFLQAAELLNKVECAYCRLIYSEDAVTLEAIAPIKAVSAPLTPQTWGEQESKSPSIGGFRGLSSENGCISSQVWVESLLGNLVFTASCLGGTLETQLSANGRSLQVILKVPYTYQTNASVRIQCRLPLLQLAFTHLASLAGFTVCQGDESVPLITDDVTLQSSRTIWVQHGAQSVPKGVKGKIDLSISPDRLKQAVAAVNDGKTWGMEVEIEVAPILSERELEILALLTQGLRDRDIAQHLTISESTVKFHINNVLAKLKSKTRYQAIHQAIVQGWIV